MSGPRRRRSRSSGHDKAALLVARATSVERHGRKRRRQERQGRAQRVQERELRGWRGWWRSRRRRRRRRFCRRCRRSCALTAREEATQQAVATAPDGAPAAADVGGGGSPAAASAAAVAAGVGAARCFGCRAVSAAAAAAREGTDVGLVAVGHSSALSLSRARAAKSTGLLVGAPWNSGGGIEDGPSWRARAHARGARVGERGGREKEEKRRRSSDDDLRPCSSFLQKNLSCASLLALPCRAPSLSTRDSSSSCCYWGWRRPFSSKTGAVEAARGLPCGEGGREELSSGACGLSRARCLCVCVFVFLMGLSWCWSRTCLQPTRSGLGLLFLAEESARSSFGLSFSERGVGGALAPRRFAASFLVQPFCFERE